MKRRFLPLLVLCALLGGCAGTLPVVPQTPAQTVLVAETEYTALLQTATDLRAAGVVNDALYAKLDAAFVETNAALDAVGLAMSLGRADDLPDLLAASQRGLATIRALLVEAKGGAQ